MKPAREPDIQSRDAKMRVKTRERLSQLTIATGLFLTSTLFVEIVRRVSGLEFGGRDSDPSILDGLCRWDCAWYGTIVNNGYHLRPAYHANQDAANWAFFPGFPLATKLIQILSTANTAESLVMTSRLFLFASITAFISYSKAIIGKERAWISGIVLAFSPYMLYAHTGYTESLYFLLTTLAFWLLDKKRWLLAGLAGGLMSGTRVVGVVFTLSYLTAAVTKSKKPSTEEQHQAYLLGLLLIPAGLATYMFFLYIHVGDALAFKHVMIAWGRETINIVDSLKAGWEIGFWGRYFIIVSVLGLAASGWHLAMKRYDMATFMAATVLIPLMSTTYSMPRYVFWQMPFLLAITEIAARHRSFLALYMVFSGSVGAIVTLAWFKGNSFVI